MQPRRLLSLDAFRGLTIAGMILVNNPGSWDHVHPPLLHAAWHGCTPTDLVFPFFLFIVGVSMAVSKRPALEGGEPARPRLAGVLRRAAVLLALGLFLNWFGRWEVSTLRFTGVLQRIALCFLLASLVTMHLRLAAQVALAAAVLLGWWAVLAFVPGPGLEGGPMSPTGNLARWFDQAVLTRAHAYRHQPTDPEGLLSTLPATVTVLAGFWAGRFMTMQPGWRAARGLALAGLAALAVGGVWGWPIAGGPLAAEGGTAHGTWPLPWNKPLWSSSYVVWSAGWALLVLAACFWAIEVRGWRRWARPLEVFGVNAILAFVGSGVAARILMMIQVPAPIRPGAPAAGGTVSLARWLYDPGLASWLAPTTASLAFAACTVAAWGLLLWGLDRRGVRLKI